MWDCRGSCARATPLQCCVCVALCAGDAASTAPPRPAVELGSASFVAAYERGVTVPGEWNIVVENRRRGFQNHVCVCYAVAFAISEPYGTIVQVLSMPVLHSGGIYCFNIL